MSRLVTQLVDTQPTIVVIAAHPVPPVIRASWSRQDVILEVVTPADIRRHAKDTLAAAFRVLYWFPDWASSEARTALEETLLVVGKHGLDVTVVAPWVTPIGSTTQQWQAWQAFSERQHSTFTQLRQHHPQLKWILGQDLVLPFEVGRSLALYSPVHDMVSELKKGRAVILDPQIVFFPQDWQGFWKSVFELSSDPGTPSTVLQGKRLMTTVLAQKIKLEYHRQTGQILQITTDPVQVAAKLTLSPAILPTTFISDEKVIETILSTLPREHTFSSTLNSPVSVAHAITPAPPTRPIAIPPHPMPQRRSLPDGLKTVQPTVPVIRAPISAVPVPKSETVDQTVDQEVQRLFQNRRSDGKQERVQDLTRQAKKTIKKTKHRQKVFWGGVAAGAAGLVVIGVFGLFWLSIRAVESSLLSTLNPTNFGTVLGVYGNSPKDQRTTLPNQLITTVLGAQVSLAGVVLDTTSLAHFEDAAALSTTVSRFWTERQSLDTTSQALFATVTGQNNANLADELTKLGGRSQKLYEYVAEIETTLAQLELPKLIENTPTAPAQLSTQLTQAKRQLTAAQLLQPLWPRLLGLEGTRTYAVVWQNSLELRPTGGFVQAVAIMDIDNGRLQTPQVFNSYQIDQLAPGEVVPPDDLAQYLGEKELFFRDSNWSPDFPTTAGFMRTYLAKSTQREIDGVIGLTLPSVRALLEVTGPVDVPGYPGAVSASNVQDRIVTHTTTPSAAATQTNDFQVALLQVLLSKLSQLKGVDSSTLLTTLTTQLAQGQLLVALTDSNEQATFQTLGWAGHLAEPLCPTPLSTAPCVIDVVSQVEANVGVNLANISVQRQVAHEVTLNPDTADHRRQITFINSNTNRTWPMGDYKTYLRLYVPTTARLDSVRANGQNVPLDDVRRGLELDKQMWGWLVTVPAGKQVVVEVRYRTSLASQPADAPTRSYGLLSQYQPGIDPVVTTTTVAYPQTWSPTLIAPSAAVAQSQVQFISSPALQSLQAVQFSRSTP